MKKICLLAFLFVFGNSVFAADHTWTIKNNSSYTLEWDKNWGDTSSQHGCGWSAMNKIVGPKSSITYTATNLDWNKGCTDAGTGYKVTLNGQYKGYLVADIRHRGSNKFEFEYIGKGTETPEKICKTSSGSGSVDNSYFDC